MEEKDLKKKAQNIIDRTNDIKMYGKNANQEFRNMVVEFESFLKEYCNTMNKNYDETYSSIVNEAYGNIGKGNNKKTGIVITSQLYWIIN